MTHLNLCYKVQIASDLNQTICEETGTNCPATFSHFWQHFYFYAMEDQVVNGYSPQMTSYLAHTAVTNKGKSEYNTSH